MLFKDKVHKEFYETQLSIWQEKNGKKADSYIQALIYTLGVCDDTRRHFSSLYDGSSVVPESIHAGWQTGGSVRITRLAFQLYTDGTPTAYLGSDNGDIEECRRYSVSDIFCCEFAPYFVEAIKLRYPEYMGE